MDEHGEVGTVVSLAESTTVSVTVSRSDESLVQNMDGEGQEGGSYNEGDGEEIMVEVVGSDVFVDGVSGDGGGLGKEGLAGRDMESFGDGDMVEDETGDARGQVGENRTETGANEEVVGASQEKAEVAVAMEGVEVVRSSKSEVTCIVAKRVEMTVTHKGEGEREDMELDDGGKNAFGGSVLGSGLDNEAWNPGIDAMAESSSLVHAPQRGQHEYVAEERDLKEQSSQKDESQGSEDHPTVETKETMSEASIEDGASYSISVSNHLTEASVKENVAKETSQSPISVEESTVASQNLCSSEENQHTKDKDNPAGNANHEILDTKSPSSSEQLKDSTDCEVAGVGMHVCSTVSHVNLNSVAVNSSGEDGGEVAATDSSSRNHVHVSPDQSADHNSNSLSSLSENHLRASQVLASETSFTGLTDDLDVRQHEVKVKPVRDLVVDSEPDDAALETELVEQEENPARTVGDLGAPPESCGGLAGDLGVREHDTKVNPVKDLVSCDEPEDAGQGTEVVEHEEHLARTVGDSVAVSESCDGHTGDLDVREHEVNFEPVRDLVSGDEPKDAGQGTEVVEQEERRARTDGDLGVVPESCDGPTGDLDVREHEVNVEPMSGRVSGDEPAHAGRRTEVLEQEENLTRTLGDLAMMPESCGVPAGDLDVRDHEVKVKPDLVSGDEPEDACVGTVAVEKEENLTRTAGDLGAAPESHGGSADDLDVREQDADAKPVNDIVLDDKTEDTCQETEVVEQEDYLARTARDSGAPSESCGRPADDLDVREHDVSAKPVGDIVLDDKSEDAGLETESVEQEENLARTVGDSGDAPETSVGPAVDLDVREHEAKAVLGAEPEDSGQETDVVEQEENLVRTLRDSGGAPESSVGHVELDVREREAKVKPMSDLVLGAEPEDSGKETEVVEQEENLARTVLDPETESESCGGATGDLVVGDHKGEDRSMSDTAPDTETNHAIVETQVVKEEGDPVGTSGGSGVEADACNDNMKGNIIYSDDLPSVKQEATKRDDGDVHAIPESSHEASSIVERGEWIGMDIDEVLDFKDEAMGLGAPVGNSSDPVKAENFPCQQMSSTDQLDIAVLHKCDVDAKDTHVAEEPVHAECKLSEDEPQMAAGDAEVVAGKNGADFKEVSSGDASSIENGKLDIRGQNEKEVPTDAYVVSSSEQTDLVATPMELVEQQGTTKPSNCVAIDERSCQLAEGNDLKDEQVDVFNGEDAFHGHDPPEDTKAGLLDASAQEIDSNVEASSSMEVKKQDGAVVANEVSGHDVDLDQSKNKYCDDKVLNEGAGSSSSSDVQVSPLPQSTENFTGEGNIVNPLPGEDQYLNVMGASEHKSALGGDQAVETSTSEIATSGEVVNQMTEREDELLEDQPFGGVQNDYEGVDNGQQDVASEGHASETNQSKILEKEILKPSSSLRIHQSGYLLPPENDGQFSTSDLVWGKVRSHPWWPGQIFDPADASDKAVKYYKKDSFLVAYFGDRTFAWNDASLLKPFRSHFSHIEKQSNSEAFQNAVNSALDEVSRRVELGLSCSCVPRDAYEKIACQIVENTGIREESSRRYGVDKSSAATSFEPDKLLQHIRLLAESPFGMSDHLELAVANAQLSAFCCFKGYRPPATFLSEEESLENDAGTSEFRDGPDHTLSVSVDGEQVPSNSPASLKRKLSFKDSLQPKKKERSLSELMGDMPYSPDEEDDLDGKASTKSVSTSSGKKRKAIDPVNDGSDRRISIYAAKVSTTSSSPKPSFKVGECIRRIASQLTGSASILKGNDQQGSDASLHISENPQRGNMVFPTDISLEEMLSQLQLAARDPKKGYSFLNNIILFFSVFRNSVVTKHASGRSGGGKKRKTSNTAGASTEEYEFDDVNDSYWTDRIVHNYSEEQLLQNGENSGGDYQLIVPDVDKVHKPNRRTYSRKQYSNGNYETSAEETAEDIERRKLSPAELVLTFAEGDSLPSEINLNKTFKRFGPLKESETEVDQDSHRARVVFKRGSDAEVAHSSAGTFKIFGPKVSYQLSYSPLTAFGGLPLLITQGQEDAP